MHNASHENIQVSEKWFHRNVAQMGKTACTRGITQGTQKKHPEMGQNTSDINIGIDSHIDESLGWQLGFP